MFYGVHNDNFSFISSSRNCFCLQCSLSLFSNTKIITVMTDHQNLKNHFARHSAGNKLLHRFCNLPLLSFKHSTVSLKKTFTCYFYNLVPERTSCNYGTLDQPTKLNYHDIAIDAWALISKEEVMSSNLRIQFICLLYLNEAFYNLPDRYR